MLFFVLFVRISRWSPHRELMGIVLGAFTVIGWGKHWMGLSVFISVTQSSELHCHVTPLNEKSGMTIYGREPRFKHGTTARRGMWTFGALMYTLNYISSQENADCLTGHLSQTTGALQSHDLSQIVTVSLLSVEQDGTMQTSFESECQHLNSFNTRDFFSHRPRLYLVGLL